MIFCQKESPPKWIKRSRRYKGFYYLVKKKRKKTLVCKQCFRSLFEPIIFAISNYFSHQLFSKDNKEKNIIINNEYNNGIRVC